MKQVRFVVVEAFKDLEDEGRVYRPGENYPHKGPVDVERAKALASEENKLAKPLLHVVEEQVDLSPLGIEDTQTEVAAEVQNVAQQLIDNEKEKQEVTKPPVKKATRKKVAEGDESTTD